MSKTECYWVHSGTWSCLQQIWKARWGRHGNAKHWEQLKGMVPGQVIEYQTEACWVYQTGAYLTTWIKRLLLLLPLMSIQYKMVLPESVCNKWVFTKGMLLYLAEAETSAHRSFRESSSMLRIVPSQCTWLWTDLNCCWAFHYTGTDLHELSCRFFFTEIKQQHSSLRIW